VCPEENRRFAVKRDFRRRIRRRTRTAFGETTLLELLVGSVFVVSVEDLWSWQGLPMVVLSELLPRL
jgi:hypothetical protein